VSCSLSSSSSLNSKCVSSGESKGDGNHDDEDGNDGDDDNASVDEGVTQIIESNRVLPEQEKEADFR